MFDYFRLVMAGPSAPQGVTEIAALLEEQARQACADCGLGTAEIYRSGGLVTLILTERDAWEAGIVGADAYQLFPGFVSADGSQITWPNVWVADNYNLNTFITALKDAIEQAARSDH